MSELNQFWNFSETEEWIRHDRYIVLCNGLEHTFGFKPATDEGALYSHVAEDQLVKGNRDFYWL